MISTAGIALFSSPQPPAPIPYILQVHKLPQNEKRESVRIFFNVWAQSYNAITQGRAVKVGNPIALIAWINVETFSHLNNLANDHLAGEAKKRFIEGLLTVASLGFPSIREFFSEYMGFIDSWLMEELRQFGIEKMHPHWSLEESEFAFTEFDFYRYSQRKRVAVCFDFTFYHQHIRTLFHAVFGMGTHPGLLSLLKHLEANNYVDVVDPIAGDIVIYCDAEEMKLLHAGLFLPNGRVISKWGKGSVWIHSVEDVETNYGSAFKVMRRIFKSPSIKKLFDTMKDPNTCCVPLTLKEFVRCTFDEHYRCAEPNLLRKSLFGYEYNQYIRRKFLEKIEAIDDDAFSVPAVIDAIHEVNALPIPEELFRLVHAEIK